MNNTYSQMKQDMTNFLKQENFQQVNECEFLCKNSDTSVCFKEEHFEVTSSSHFTMKKLQESLSIIADKYRN